MTGASLVELMKLELQLERLQNLVQSVNAPMKLNLSILFSLTIILSACQPRRLSPVVFSKPDAQSKPASKPAGSPTASAASKTAAARPSAAAEKAAAAARLAAKKKKLAAARRAQAKRMAVASLEAGRQLLREEQDESALKAFKEAVRLNSRSAEAWMGIAFVHEKTGNTRDALEAFKEAKKIWGL
jgi:Flp pilus assembly protein TadD